MLKPYIFCLHCMLFKSVNDEKKKVHHTARETVFTPGYSNQDKQIGRSLVPIERTGTKVA